VKSILYSFIILFLCFTTYAQNTVVGGTVVDAKTKEAVPFANVVFKGTRIGAIADINGVYLLTSSQASDSVIVTYLGYRPQTIKIKKNTTQEINFELQDIGQDLGEVTIKTKRKDKKIPKDTTAYMLYQKVVDNKPVNNPSSINSYKFESYTKMEMDVINIGKGWKKLIWMFKPFRYFFSFEDSLEDGTKYVPALIREKLSTISYNKLPEKKQEVVHASKISGIQNNSINTIAEFQLDEINIYDNVILIAGRSFIAPFSPIARGTYKYFLNDTLSINGRTSYLLKFAPISLEDLAFTGNVWVDSATYAIQSVLIYPNPKVNLNFITDYKISQTFIQANTKQWIVKDEKIEALVTLFDNRKSIAGYVRKTNNRKDIAVDLPFDTKNFEGDKLKYDTAHNVKSDEYWASKRFEPLVKREQMIYEAVDSMRRTNTFKRFEWAAYLVTSAYFRTGAVEFGRFYTFISRNSIEGWRPKFGFRTTNEFSKRLMFQGYIAYGLKDKQWKYEALAMYNPKTKNEKWFQITLATRYDLNILGQTEGLFAPDNFFYIFRKTPLVKMMKIRETVFTFEKEVTQGLNLNCSLSYRRFFATPGVLDFTYKDGSNLKSIPVFTDVPLQLGIRYSFDEIYLKKTIGRAFVASKYPVLSLEYTMAVKDVVGSDYTYQKFDFLLRHRFPSPIGFTKYRVYAGLILGTAPYPLHFLTAGNTGFIFNHKNYNLLRDFEFASDKYLALWFEHHFDGFIFNKIPYFSKLKLREVLCFKGLWGGMSEKNRRTLELPKDLLIPSPIPYIECGFAIENIAKILRVDFIWRATYRDSPGAPKWGIKFSFVPSF
jgi:hypothetical protein